MSQDLSQKDLMFRLLRIYIVEYLTTVHGFKNIQQEGINMLALYIIKTVQKLVIPIKRLLSLQGITIPNSLHLVNTIHETKFVDMIQLIGFILNQSKTTTKNIQTFYTGLENIGRSLFQEQSQEINQHKPQNIYPNIRYIPHVYLYNCEENPLPIKAPLDQGLRKPAQYTYKSTNEKVEKIDKSIQKLGNYSVRQMRRSLGILSVEQKDQMIEKQKKLTQRKSQRQRDMQNNIMKKKSYFSMINYV